MRAYTPTSSDDDMGYFDLVIKVHLHMCLHHIECKDQMPRAPRSAHTSQCNACTGHTIAVALHLIWHP